MIADPRFWLALLVGALVHRALPDRFRSAWIVLISLAFLGSLDPAATALMVAVTTAVWFAVPRWSGSRSGAAALIVSLVGLLLAFKVAPALGSALGTTALDRVLLPIGISYWTFKLIHMVADTSAGRLKPASLADTMAWVSLFPAFIAGPIERFDHFSRNRNPLDPEALPAGITRIAQGLIKKLLVADFVVHEAMGSASVFLDTLPAHTTLEAWVFVMLSCVYAYLDFSAYSDLAIGASRLFGIRLAENFNWPLLAPNIGVFWKRWHMSLTGFCQSYVYMPLMGLSRNPYLATFGTFFVMGMWHGVSFNWLGWGLFHGTGVVAHTAWTRVKRRRRWSGPSGGRLAYLGIAPTFLYVSAANSFTATADLGGWAALRLLCKLLGIDVAAWN